MSKQVIVSVIIPCFNQAIYLGDALNSVLSQTFKNWECIIINDGSTDDTEKVCRNFAEIDNRIKCISINNSGLSNARNTGIDEAIGKYILPLDADDYLSNNYIDEAVKVFENEDVKLVYGSANYFGLKSGEWKLLSYSYRNLLANNVIHCSALFRKSDWKLVGGYDTQLKLGLEDWEYYIRLLDKNDKVKCLTQITFYYRVKENSMITSLDENSRLEAMKYIQNKHARKYFWLYNQLNKRNNYLEEKINSKKYLIKRLIKLLIE